MQFLVQLNLIFDLIVSLDSDLYIFIYTSSATAYFFSYFLPATFYGAFSSEFSLS